MADGDEEALRLEFILEEHGPASTSDFAAFLQWIEVLTRSTATEVVADLIEGLPSEDQLRILKRLEVAPLPSDVLAVEPGSWHVVVELAGVQVVAWALEYIGKEATKSVVDGIVERAKLRERWRHLWDRSAKNAPKAIKKQAGQRRRIKGLEVKSVESRKVRERPGVEVRVVKTTTVRAPTAKEARQILRYRGFL